jgi:hypothetical protein
LMPEFKRFMYFPFEGQYYDAPVGWLRE